MEVVGYLTSKSSFEGHVNIPEFWKKSAGTYPILSQLANLHLPASDTFVSVECMFSTTGLIANSKRSSFSAEKLQHITFIHYNFDIVLRHMSTEWMMVIKSTYLMFIVYILTVLPAADLHFYLLHSTTQYSQLLTSYSWSCSSSFVL